MNLQLHSHLSQSQTPCDVCGSQTVRELYTAPDRLCNKEFRWTIAECMGCSVWRTLPEITDDDLFSYYDESYWGASEPSESWIRSSQSEKTDFLTQCGLDSGKILDVGCGAGFFLRALDPARWERFGIEPSESAATTAERALGNGRVVAGTLTQSGLKESTFDVITLWSALEHSNEPRANLKEAKRLLKPGGTIIIQVPNAASYQARLFGGSWFALDAPRHRYHFTLPLLETLLRENGFDLFLISFFSREHNSHALRQSLKTVLFRNGAISRRILFYLSLPFIKPADKLMSALGKGATLTLAARA